VDGTVITLAASSGKRSVTVWRPSVCLSVCPVGILTVTYHGAAYDTASAHFGPTLRRIDILVICPIAIAYSMGQIINKMVKSGQFTTKCKGNKVIALKLQKSLRWDSA